MLQTKSFLYVEDDGLSREVMKLIMQNIIVTEQFTIFEDSENFIERIQQLADMPDIIFLDIRIKPHDGFEMLSMLRRVPVFQDTPIIALTASVMNPELKKLQDAGFTGAISKPLDMDTFPALLQKIIEGDSVWHIT